MKRIIIITVITCMLGLFVSVDTISQVIIKVKPIRPKVVLIKANVPRPGPSYVWIDGHWQWDKRSSSYIWAKGKWVKNKRNRIWISGHWHKVTGGWKWVPGHWKRR